MYLRSKRAATDIPVDKCNEVDAKQAQPRGPVLVALDCIISSLFTFVGQFDSDPRLSIELLACFYTPQ